MKVHRDILANLAERRRLERRERDARRGRLGRGRFDQLVRELAGVIRLAFEAGATGSLFGLEGPLRHGIRADLCLQGWHWHDADQMARELMDEAFKAVRATRPSWNEGQREWTVEAGTLIERTRCAHCGKPLPEGHHKFCRTTCANVYHSRLSRLKDGAETAVVRIAVRVMT
ncbi:hypothetical protein [Pseudogemmobacter blasticus]|uniref:Uncharacterized protein n=1 Tax=Fuscovulum blasticum DSM 2131 TaxID=1188250 RepID=A0A2T4JDJ6_FUSBL|nr:hypothetical protein [Fuscovulum blasticum]PTE15990.1 hypothetical protein C5F44_02835 [Fuscovulum blasticum DSM 2131]